MPPFKHALPLLCALFFSAFAHADEVSDTLDSLGLGGLKGMAGAGYAYRPYDPTASHYEFKPIPYLDLSLGSIDLDSEDGLSWNALKLDGWSAGPFVNYVPGRDGDDQLRGLRNVPGMGEVGGFVEYSPFEGLRAFARTGHTFGGASGQGGMLAQLGSEADYPLGPQNMGIFGGTTVTAHYANAEQTRTFFGVSQQESAASGIRPYRANGGLQDITLSQSAAFPLVGNWSLLTSVSWVHLTDSAADSSIVKQRGSADQGEVDAALAYHF
jgi:outer membrane scaffolding protein for murein synthesis (MipA/OmpV family)